MWHKLRETLLSLVKSPIGRRSVKNGGKLSFNGISSTGGLQPHANIKLGWLKSRNGGQQ